MLADIRKLKLPLWVFRSKSGGAHLYVFFIAAVSGEWAQALLARWRKALGLPPRTEIFPKQKRLVDATDTGNWLNMPFFSCYGKERGLRYAYDPDTGVAIHDPAVFLKRLTKTSEGEADAIQIVKEESPAEAYKKMPPCLEAFCKQGAPDGCRNVGLFQFAVYSKKRKNAGEDIDMEQEVASYNEQFMEPPLSRGDVRSVLKSAVRKDYQYLCQDPALQAVCNKTQCRKRVYGVGGSGGGGGDDGTTIPRIDQMPIRNVRKYAIETPVYYFEIGEQSMKLTSQDLTTQVTLLKAIFECTNQRPRKTTDDRFAVWLTNNFSNPDIIQPIEAETERGALLLRLREFLRDNLSVDPQDLVIDRVYEHDGMCTFRFEAWRDFCQRMRITTTTPMGSLLRELGASPEPWNIGGMACQVWTIRTPENLNMDLEDETIPSVSNAEF
jgi:hypothetical protein